MSNKFPYKVLAVVKFNQGEALVLDKPIELKYNMHGTTIIGTDGVFHESLFYEHSYPGWQAFAGRKFDILLENGEIVHCHGQYWGGRNATTERIVGKSCQATVHDIEALRSCYVFIGRYANPEKLSALRATYRGPVFEYWDYEQMVRPRKKVRLSFFRKYRRQKRERPHLLTSKTPNTL